MPRPPRTLLAVLFTTTGVVTAVLCAAGWILFRQQDEIDRQRRATALEERADAIAANMRGRLADAGDRLGAWLSGRATPPEIERAVVAGIDASGVRLTPEGALPYVPGLQPDERDRTFDELEAREFRVGAVDDAAAGYRALARDRNPRIRAGALLRLGRLLRRTGDMAGALDAYERLGELDTRVDGFPTGLAALLGRRAVHLARGDHAAAEAESLLLQQGLDAGRFAVTRAQAEHYRAESSKTPRPPAWLLAEAASEVWRTADGRLAPRGQRVALIGGRAVVVIWRASADRAALATAFVDEFFGPIDAAGARWTLADAATGQRLAGGELSGASHVSRVVDAEYPWTLEMAADASAAGPASAFTPLVSLLGVTLVFLWATTYAMARAIRREAAVARLQSDFVAAVSHEFRSPLTTVRQLAELLESARQPNEDRRRLYYRVIAAEAARLQRLIETLLNFGRMEAGAERYQLAPIEAAALVRAVAGDMEMQARDAGARIELAGPEVGARVMADEAALGVALRNLVDNALKYSLGSPIVRIEWATEGERVALRVIDRGLGIPPAEQAAIFRKFVRGQAAAQANVGGTGVGLAMVQRIVTAHLGEVRLESEVGRGSTFTLLLPAAGSAAAARLSA